MEGRQKNILIDSDALDRKYVSLYIEATNRVEGLNKYFPNA